VPLFFAKQYGAEKKVRGGVYHGKAAQNRGL
jgi:hypothetical protein